MLRANGMSGARRRSAFACCLLGIVGLGSVAFAQSRTELAWPRHESRLAAPAPAPYQLPDQRGRPLLDPGQRDRRPARDRRPNGDPEVVIEPGWVSVVAETVSASWRILFPGVYAAPAYRLQVAATIPVTLTVLPDAGDLTAANGAALPTWYSFGTTLEEAEAFGWIAARQLGGMSFPELLGPPAPEGKTLTIWLKIDARKAPADNAFRAILQFAVLASS